jgi:hypothetical protein
MEDSPQGREGEDPGEETASASLNLWGEPDYRLRLYPEGSAAVNSFLSLLC